MPPNTTISRNYLEDIRFAKRRGRRINNTPRNRDKEDNALEAIFNIFNSLMQALQGLFFA